MDLKYTNIKWFLNVQLMYQTHSQNFKLNSPRVQSEVETLQLRDNQKIVSFCADTYSWQVTMKDFSKAVVMILSQWE